MDAAIDERIKTKVRDCLRKGNKLFKAKAKIDTLQYTNQTKTHGSAGWDEKPGWYIRLSKKAIEGDPEFIINDTIPHEVAHIVAMWLELQGMEHGDKGHGEGWQTIAKALGHSGEAKGKVAEYQYQTDSGKRYTLNQSQHDAIHKEFRRLRTPEGEPLTAKHFQG